MDPVKELLDARLNRTFDRRSVIKGLGGIAALGAISPTLLAACAAPGSSAQTTAGATAGTSAGASAGSSPAGSSALGGVINFIGYDGEDALGVAKPFFDANGIKMQSTYLADSNEALTKFQTGGRGQMDMMANNHNVMRKVLTAVPAVEFMAPLDMDRLANAAGLFPALKQAPWVAKDGQTYSIPLVWGDEPIVFDPKKWPSMPPKYTDFADPKYKGEIVLSDNGNSNIWLFSKSLGFGDPTPNRITQAQLDQVVAAMLDVKPNVVTIAKSLGDQADVMIRGDASIGLAGWAYQITIAKNKGVTLASESPSVDGTYYWCDSYAIFPDAPNVDNAYAFINYMSSPESSAAIADALGSGACIEGALDIMDETAKGMYPYEVAREYDASSPLYTTSTAPPEADEGEIVGSAKWVEAWQKYKLS
jgi:spermidine/putrescine-binding protein